MPSYFDSLVKRTVRMGMLTPTPSVSVPQMTFSSPCCASCSTSSRYFGQQSGVMDADAEAEKATHVLAVGRVAAEVADRSRIVLRSRPWNTR